ncbi:MAG: hypothetical protein ACR2RD_01915 [Woeseiaceae bacterium]
MTKGIVKIIVVLLVLLASSGCSTTNPQRSVSPYERPILSATEARSMIRVEVRTLEPIPAEEAVAALTD